MTNNPEEHHANTRDDDFMVQFFRRWSAFGGGPAEDIMVNFGISKREYEDRLYDLACSNRIRRYPPEVKDLILTFCSSRQLRRHRSAPQRLLVDFTSPEPPHDMSALLPTS
ncbi:hypothetical protein [Rhodococcus qingshengii]|uniref:hypothetical protein n=1 Tax=Rhodococcus qingshengii TaxID=334542 RepID=UPI001C5D8A20|nr:hypothetical protein [Rhodococcus qingshengii]MBW4818409.1 hypothetical protein [Rhodococcus qingshengii]